MPKKRYYDKKMSKKEGGMISKTDGFACMPTGVVMKLYPKDMGYMPENLNDGLSGVDSQVSSDFNSARRDLSKTKY